MLKSEKSGRLQFIKDKLLFLILIILLFNTFLIALGYHFAVSRFAGGDSILLYKQELAHDLSGYSQRLARNLEVYDLPSVRDALAEYDYEVELATGSDELIEVIINQGRLVQEIIHAEADSRLKERVLIAVNNDIRVQDTKENTRLVISIVDGQLSVFPEQFLGKGTVKHINQIFSPNRYHSSQIIYIEVENGVGQLVFPHTFEDHVRVLSDDLSSMRISLHETRVRAGLAEMVGPGIILQVYDAENGRGSDSLVHDADIRDLVNELFSSGASGISVGNQRLTATSAIRCIGPLIMVNHKQIAANPVIIQAVGDPELLKSGLQIITGELKKNRGLRFEISASGFIKLPAYIYSE